MRQRRKHTRVKGKNGRKRKKQSTKGRVKQERKEGGCIFVLLVVFVRSVACRALYCCVRCAGCHSHQEHRCCSPLLASSSSAAAAGCSHNSSNRDWEGKREREKETPSSACISLSLSLSVSVCVCVRSSLTISNVVLVVSRVYTDSRFSLVIVVHIEVNHECHQ